MAPPDQPIHLLNRQLSGMYRRTNTISLNAPLPVPSPLSSALLLEPTSTAAGVVVGGGGSVGDNSASTCALPPSFSTSTASTHGSDAHPSSDFPIPTSTTKRKLRAPPTSTTSSTPKRSKLPPPSSKHAPPSTRLSDLGGVDACIGSMLEIVALPICHPEVYLHTGVRPPRGVLLVGPPGCGKTMLAGAIAGELGCPFISISAPSIVSGMSGESEKTLRETFEEAAKLAPCILFIDEIDAITPKRETAQREMERRIVAQLLTCMDDLSWDKTGNKPVVIIGATNRPDSLDPALRRAGRFDAEITMGVPDEAGRERILRVLMAKLRLSGDFDYSFLAKSTPGYVGADLSALTGAAGVIAVKRIFEQFPGEEGEKLETAMFGGELRENGMGMGMGMGMGEGMGTEDEEMQIDEEELVAFPSEDVSIPLPNSTPFNPSPAAPPSSLSSTPLALFSTLPPSLLTLPIASFLLTHPHSLTSTQLSFLSLTNSDFTHALSIVQPSSQREGFTTVPNVTWSDLGALKGIREEMRMSIVRPIRRPELFAMVGIQAPCGVLLWGPPGCGKTLLAKAVANESRANFISVKGPELLNKYVGESERAVRQVFARARASSPCIIFFDELDAMVPRRDDSLSESSARVVNTLLTELDGLDPRKQVFVIGATNRPDILDPAMVRPGRLDKLLYVDLPTPDERVEILRAQTKNTPLGEDVDLESVAREKAAEGFSGADLSALVREAAVSALREVFSEVELGDDLDLDRKTQPHEVKVKEKKGKEKGEEEEEEDTKGDNAKVPARVVVGQRHFLDALKKTFPSVSVQQRKRFAMLRVKFAGQPVGHAREGGGNERESAPGEMGEAVGGGAAVMT